MLGQSSESMEVEQRLCATMAELHPKNYYAWNHRLWLLKFMSAEQLEAELRWMHQWMRTHVSDHSAANHLEQTIIALSAAAAAGDAKQAFRSTLAIVLQQIDLASVAVDSRPGHETLWYHKRKLFLFAVQLLTHQDSKVRWCASCSTEAQMTNMWDECRVVSRQIWSAADSLPDEAATALDKIERALSAALQDCSHHSDEQPTTAAELMGEDRHDYDTTEMSTLLWRLASSEIAVACVALRNEQAWEYAKQRTAALRFVEFVLHNMLRYLTRYETGGDAAPNDTHPLQLADASIHCERLNSGHPFARRIAQCAVLVNEHLAREGTQSPTNNNLTTCTGNYC